jgi:UMF1 family MFS transporter
MSIPTTTTSAEKTPRVYQRHIFAWAMYSWALDGLITTTIVTFFPPYFIAIAIPAFLEAGKVASDKAAAAMAADNASNVFALSIALALFIAALIAPIAGTYADITGRRKRILIVATALGSILGSMMLTLTTGAWLLGLALYIGTQIAVNVALGMNSSLLPHVARPDDLNRVSSLGYAMAYIGGGILLLANTLLLIFGDQLGIAGDTAVRIAFFTTGVWWIIFSLPLMFAVPEPPAAPVSHAGERHALKDALIRLRHTLRDAQHYRELFKMLVAFWLYSEGISAIILLGTAYGASLGLDSTALVGAILMTEFVGLPYVLIFGRIPEASSKWRSAYVSIVFWTAITLPILGFYANRRGDLDVASTLLLLLGDQVLGVLFSASAGRHFLEGFTRQLDTKRTVILGLAVFMIIPIWGFFLKTTAEFFMIGWLEGTAQGGVQALSRTIYANLSPKQKSGEFFGLYGLCDRFAGILAPLLYGLIGLLTHSPQASILSVVVFFAVGMFALWRVDDRAGAAVAAAEDAADDGSSTSDVREPLQRRTALPG